MLLMLAAAGGIALIGVLPALPPPWVLIPLSVLAVVLWLAPLLRALATFAAGLGWGLASGYLLLADQLQPAAQGRDINVTGEIVGLPQARETGQMLLLRPDAASAATLPSLIRLSWFGGPPLGTGDRCRLTVRLKAPRGLSNPGGFDYHTWLVGQGIGATGYVRDSPDNHCSGTATALSVGRWRQHLGRFLARESGQLNHVAFLQALTIGDRQAISETQWQVLRRTGTQHLMAISGLHIGLVATLGYLLGGLLGRVLVLCRPLSGAVRYTSVASSLSLAGVYAALAGFSLPTQRALVMVVLVHICLLRRRPVPIFHILSLTLLLVLLWSPLAAHSAGFWLSFGAVAALLLGFCGRRLVATGRGWRYLRQTVWSQWVVLVGLLVPLSCLGLPAAPLAPLANTVAIPLVSWLVVPPLLSACLLADIAPGLSRAALASADVAFDGVWRYLLWVDALAPPVQPLATGPVVLMLALSGGLLLLGPRHLPLRWLGLCCLLPLWLPPTGDQPPLRITVLDVGQGLAVVIATPGRTLVYDAGPRFSERFDAGSDIVAPFLQHRRIRTIDRLIVSHGDIDHSGGARALVAAVPTGLVLAGEADPMPGAVLSPCRAGTSWQWDAVTFTLLAPALAWDEADNIGAGNDRSCVLLVEYAEQRILLPGDISVRSEVKLLAAGSVAGPLSVLVAPHHGSNTSSSPAWVDALQPAFVVFSTGYGNRYRHPHAAVVERYRAGGAVLLNTAVTGAVEFVWHADTAPAVIRYRQRQRRYWFAESP
ncbi:DNA internalization-related competence protein ComEC/Rec2 [Exilibacterium tricleocarpae]|uniref:DNA internalization-related competence protein ComEC/Rec2 n=1 Tax=Exilibacterium tricleocarpae TaxID=2591008 RepID=A0A545TVS5_9GAMM|nr:DNA internalization-related competence protein ComEC/Rec2 [Exilibacterium tricleocarpae]TQV81327.1 DNA internalization-related competence protein ComEC/Rec2 [Exilibacterium tricleocarpae]